MTTTDARIESLERRLRRQRQVGLVALLFLLTLGAVQRSGPGDIEATSLTIVDEAGRPLARLTGRDCGRLELLDAVGRKRVTLGENSENPGASSLVLRDAAGGADCELMAGPGRRATLLMSLLEGPRTSIWATLSPDESAIHFEAGGFPGGVAIGAGKHDQLLGGWLSMNYGRPTLTEGGPGWATKGTYFSVSPDARTDRPADQIRRMVPE